MSLPPPLFPTLSPVTFDQQSTETKSIIFIEFDGLDTVAEIFFNGVKVGSSSNQFVQVRTDNLAPLLLTSENTIQVVFKSAVKFGQIQAEKYPYPVPDGFAPEQHGERNRNMVRKEQCSFSWDWGPCFATCGIWKSCRLVQLDDINTTFHVTRFSPDISWVNDVGSEEEKCFSIDVSVNMILAAKENNDSNQSCLAQVKLEIKGRPDLPSTTIKNVKPIPLKQGRQNHHHTKINLKIPCKLIQLWWPAGYGEQPLYTLQLTILPTTASSSEKKFTRRIGFRRIKLIQDPIPPIGTSFYFQVNGINIFAKGANFVPCHALESQVSVETLRLLLAASVEANMNMIRCWGGGIYQRDEFYELADELGLMVWQECMFACAMCKVLSCDESKEQQMRCIYFSLFIAV